MESLVYKSYVKQVLRYPLMNFEQEVAHSKLIQQGDNDAKMRLVQANLRLVISIAKKYENQYTSIMDLIQEGNIGLLTAASKYHYAFNTRFSTYAYSWIQQAISRYIHNKCGMILIPHRKEEILRKVHSAKIALLQQNGVEPTLQEIAARLNLEVDEIKKAEQFSFSMVSMDAEFDNDSGQTYADTIIDTQYSPEQCIIDEINTQQIHDMIKTLPEMEQKVLYRRFNFQYDTKINTLRQLGEELGVSAETIRQMEMRAIKKLQKRICNTDISLPA